MMPRIDIAAGHVRLWWRGRTVLEVHGARFEAGQLAWLAWRRHSWQGLRPVVDRVERFAGRPLIRLPLVRSRLALDRGRRRAAYLHEPRDRLAP